MIKVWILVAFINGGHFTRSLVPTGEFKTQAKCEAAIKAFSKAVEGKRLKIAEMECVEIEK